MADVSRAPQAGTQVRVFVSGEGASMERAHNLAARLENVLGMKGSSVMEQQGRWDGAIEDGYVIEVNVDWMGTAASLSFAGEVLQKQVEATGLTFYVTAAPIQCMEVF